MLDLKQGLKILSIALTASLSAGVAQAAEVIGGPTGAQFSLANLPDGNYRFCSSRPPSDINRVSGICFRFRKQGSAVTGDYYYPYEGSSLCLNGRVNGNTVTGQAVERMPENAGAPDRLGSEQLYDWRPEGFLQVRRGIYVDDRNRRDAIRYRSALLNLNSFYQYNAGTVLPPADCPTRPNSAIGTDPDADNLREVGTSMYYEKPVYLDTSSIEPLGDSRYAYTTVIGVPSRLSETEYRLDCDDLETVQVLRSRYYDGDGDLQEIEEVNQAVPANPDNPSSTQRYNASRYICSEYAGLASRPAG
ncbi:MAG: hypothetical protein F6J97_16700 [Leptolyngbya sp. SIO4C1]|nr:hypothetical protein [Leptolyngbya sp. SIO4C1]